MNVEQLLMRIVSHINRYLIFLFNILFYFFKIGLKLWLRGHLILRLLFNFLLRNHFPLCLLIVKQNQTTDTLLLQSSAKPSFLFLSMRMMLFRQFMMNCFCFFFLSLLQDLIKLQRMTHWLVLLNWSVVRIRKRGVIVVLFIVFH